MTLQEQQITWLEDIYKGFIIIARAIIKNNEVMAQDAVSNAVVSLLTQIKDGKCKASTKAQFSAWARTAVRRQSFVRHKYSGDIVCDKAAEQLRYESRPDRRHIQALDDKYDAVNDFYTRNETV